MPNSDVTLAIQVAFRLRREIINYLNEVVEKYDLTPWYWESRQVKVTQIAIPVRVLKESRRTEMMEIGGPSTNKAVRPGAYADEEIARLYELPGEVWKKKEVRWEQVQRNIRRAVVLGGPGSGKTFLTQLAVVSLAREQIKRLEEQKIGASEVIFPIRLTLNQLADMSTSGKIEEILIEAVQAPNEIKISECLLPYLTQAIKEGRALIALDSLDEVPFRKKNALSRHLGSMKDLKCRFFITCRTANWEERREWVKWEKVDEYELAPFRWHQLREFVDKWFTAAHGNGNIPSRAVSRVNRVMGLLRNNISFRRTCMRSPLLLTFACLAHN